MLKLDPPLDSKKILIQSCCGPCSSAITECLLNNSFVPVLFFFNPNIFPYSEYVKRRDENKRYADYLGIEFVEGEYDHDKWKMAVKGLENEPERGKRCQVCFNMRLEATAKYAASHNIEIITSTLATSRWKDLKQLSIAGNMAVRNVEGVSFWDKNWRKGGLSERKNEIIKEFNFYNQQYCGCEYSMRNLK